MSRASARTRFLIPRAARTWLIFSGIRLTIAPTILVRRASHTLITLLPPPLPTLALTLRVIAGVLLPAFLAACSGTPTEEDTVWPPEDWYLEARAGAFTD